MGGKDPRALCPYSAVSFRLNLLTSRLHIPNASVAAYGQVASQSGLLVTNSFSGMAHFYDDSGSGGTTHARCLTHARWPIFMYEGSNGDHIV
jgi:hypothetical protein